MFPNISNRNSYINSMKYQKQTSENTKAPQETAEENHKGRNEVDLFSNMDLPTSDDYKISAVVTKMNAGKKLSNYDLSCLRKKDPEMYAKAESIQQERRVLERRLKQCKSKAELRSINCYKIMSIGGSMQTQNAGQSADYNEHLSARIANTNDVYLQYSKTHKLSETNHRSKYDKISISYKNKY